MKTSELLAKLNAVAPALSANDIVPINSYVWFTGKTLMTHNGKLSISVPLETDFACAVPGKTIIELIKTSRAKTIELTPNGDELKIRGASTKMDFQTMAKDQFNHRMPEAPTKGLKVDAGVFLSGIDACLRASSNDTTRSDYLGVTIMPDDDGVTLYGASDARLARASVEFEHRYFKDRVILSSDFCRHLLTLGAGAKSLRLAIVGDVAVYADKGGTIMSGNLGVVDKPLPFHDVFKRVHSDKDAKRLIKIPSKLLGILERACVVSASDAATIRTHIEISDGVAHFATESRHAKVEDTMQVPSHPDVSGFEVDAKEVNAVVAHFDKMLITEKAFVLASATAHHCISGRG